MHVILVIKQYTELYIVVSRVLSELHKLRKKFCLENPVDRGAWWAAVHGVARVGHDWVTSLSLFTFMHWRRKWQPTPVFLPGESQGWGSLVGCRLGSHRVGHNWSDLAAAAAERNFDLRVLFCVFAFALIFEALVTLMINGMERLSLVNQTCRLGH